MATAFRWLMIAAVITGFNTSGWAQETDQTKTESPKSNMPFGARWAQDNDIGQMEYLSSCAACHGLDGKGNGPLSVELKSTPADLTALAKKNNGVFPVSTVYEMIDGRKPISAHGTRDMPIWGFRYIPSVNEWFAQPSDFNLNLAGNTEMMVRTRILALVDYLNRIQEK